MEGRLNVGRNRMVAIVSAFIAVYGSPLIARGESSEARFEDISIEDPSGRALDHFFEALRRTANGDEDATTRIAHYGDSYIVGDQITGTVRALYQKRYGDGGPGFVLAGRPWEWYRRIGVRNSSSSGWGVYRALTGGPEDGYFGYGGVTFSTNRSNRRVWFETRETEEGPTKVSSIDIHYLAQPGGGDIELLVDGEHLLTISTSGEDTHSAFHQLDVSEGSHEFTLITGGGPVRLFGAALEQQGPGVVYDSLGINGACGTVLGRIDEDHMTQQFAHRRPNLVILAFGANGSNRQGLVDRYRETITPVFEQVRRASNGASCLVVAPLDRGERLADGTVRSHRNVARIVAAQRQAAFDAGCAFFDTHAAMGGVNSMRRWSRDGLASSDMIHPTSDGAELIGRGLFRALERAFHSANDAAHQHGTAAVPAGD